MGEKAKAAIQQAEQSFKNLTRALEDLIRDFQNYQLQKSHKKEVSEKLKKHLDSKYPGAPTTTSIQPNDQAGKAFVQDYEKFKAACKKAKLDSRQKLIIVDQHKEAGEKALNTLSVLVTNKKAKRNEAGKNPAKALIALAKTSSLGDLEKNVEQLKALLKDVRDKTIGIRAFFEKVKSDA
jgi:hypothetical protein